MRWLGAVVSEAYRILVHGGIYLYPGDARPDYRRGRLRLLYEANPIAMLIEQAGGMATDGFGRILDLVPADIHEHVPLIFGSSDKVERVIALYAAQRTAGRRNDRCSRCVACSSPDRKINSMSVKHPIISVTGSSGAGTTTVRSTFERIFLREKIERCLDRGRRVSSLRSQRHAAGDGRTPQTPATTISAISVRKQSAGGAGKTYSRNTAATDQAKPGTMSMMTSRPSGSAPPGTFTEWERFPAGTNVLFYEGLHGAVVTEQVNVARHADLKIGVVPVINLEWIQKIHRDKATRGYSTEAVTDTILRRMPDYVRYICPQFTETDVNFQRVPTVDTSNPFVARWIPTARQIARGDSLSQLRAASTLPISFRCCMAASCRGRIQSLFPAASWTWRCSSILTPMILQLIERSRRAS